MKTKIVAAALAIGLWAHAWSSDATPDLTGDWVGVVTEAVPFPLIMHVHDEIRLDSPDRGVFGMLGEAGQSGNHVKIVFSNGSAFDGDLKGDRLAGAYLRGPAAIPLVFERQRLQAGGGTLELPSRR